MKKIITLIFLALPLLVIGCGGADEPADSQSAGLQIVQCADDAKICADGTIVTRQGANCEYAACPNETPDAD